MALHVFRTGPLEIRPEDRLVLVEGRALMLSVHEFQLLLALAHEPPRVMTREELYREAWGRPLRHGDRSVDVCVRKLRVKLAGAAPGWTFIHTHAGFGYRLTAERSQDFNRGVTVR